MLFLFAVYCTGLGREKVTYLFHLPMNMNIKNHLLGILFEQEFHSVHAV